MTRSEEKVYSAGVMNQQASTDTSANSANGGTDAVSRRAYELWEKDGRPEGSDLRHWLQAEQELAATPPDNGKAPAASNNSRSNDSTSSARNTSADTRPLQGTRGGTAPARDMKRASNPPFNGNGDRGTTGNGNGQNAGKRKPSNAPVL